MTSLQSLGSYTSSQVKSVLKKTTNLFPTHYTKHNKCISSIFLASHEAQDFRKRKIRSDPRRQPNRVEFLKYCRKTQQSEQSIVHTIRSE